MLTIRNNSTAEFLSIRFITIDIEKRVINTALTVLRIKTRILVQLRS